VVILPCSSARAQTCILCSAILPHLSQRKEEKKGTREKWLDPGSKYTRLPRPTDASLSLCGQHRDNDAKDQIVQKSLHPKPCRRRCGTGGCDSRQFVCDSFSPRFSRLRRNPELSCRVKSTLCILQLPFCLFVLFCCLRQLTKGWGGGVHYKYKNNRLHSLFQPFGLRKEQHATDNRIG